MAATSIKARIFSLRQAASALVRNGRDPATITGLAGLVTATAFEEILTYYWEHAIQLKIGRGELAVGENHPSKAGVTGQTGAIATALLAVAKYHAKLGGPALAHLASLARDVRPPQQSEISVKIRNLLNELSVPATRAALMHLPQTLMEQAEKLVKAERLTEAGRVAMIATAIRIELMIPLRITNLSQLRLDKHFLRFDPRRSGFSMLSIPAGEVKNGVFLQWPIDPKTSAFIERYIAEFRCLQKPGDSNWLFPSANGERQEARSVCAIRDGITDAIAEHVGVKMHVHAFRAFVGMLLLEDSPDGREDLRLLLGHKSMHTAERYYAYMKPAHAAYRVAAIMERARKGISRLGNSKIKGAPRQWTGRRGRA